VVFHNLGDFLNSVGSVTRANWSEQSAVDYGHNAAEINVGDIRFGYAHPDSGAAGNVVYREDFTSGLDGIEIGILGQEKLDMHLWDSQTGAALLNRVYSFGFEISENQGPNNVGPDGVTAFVDSTFTFEVFSHYDAAWHSETVSFGVPDNAGGFVGVWSDTPIQHFFVREVQNDVGDEVFGDWYAGTTAMPPAPLPAPIPEPSSFVVMGGLVLMGLACCGRRRRRK
jgi:hypothetical protein